MNRNNYSHSLRIEAESHTKDGGEEGQPTDSWLKGVLWRAEGLNAHQHIEKIAHALPETWTDGKEAQPTDS